MSQDERPGEERDQDELIAAFAALGGPLTDAGFVQLPGPDEYYGVMVRLAALLLDEDLAAARAVVRDSLCAVQNARVRLDDADQARACLRQAVVDRSRSVRWRRTAGSRDAPQAAPGAPGAAGAGTGYLHQEPPVSALGALPYRQREAVVLRHHNGPIRTADRPGDGHQHQRGQEPPGPRHVLTPAPVRAMITAIIAQAEPAPTGVRIPAHGVLNQRVLTHRRKRYDRSAACAGILSAGL